MRFLVKLFMRVFILLLLLTGLFLAVLTMAEYRPDSIEEVEIENNQSSKVVLEEPFSLMSFNIGYAGLGKDEDFVMDGGEMGRPESKDVVNGYLNNIMDYIEENPMAFYLMQEMDKNSRRSYYINQVEALKNQLGSQYSSMFAYNFNALFVPFPITFNDYIGYVESGMQTLSAYEVNEASRYQFPGAFSWPLRVANLKRGMIVSRVPVEATSKELVVINVHLSAYDDGSMRKQEMDMLKTKMIEEYEAGNYVIVGGDFNQTFPEAIDLYPVKQDYYVAHPIEETFLPDGFSFQVDLSAPTARLLNQPYEPASDNTQYYIIDGFIVSDNVHVDTVYTDDLAFENSDHNPVIIEVWLKEDE